MLIGWDSILNLQCKYNYEHCTTSVLHWSVYQLGWKFLLNIKFWPTSQDKFARLIGLKAGQTRLGELSVVIQPQLYCVRNQMQKCTLEVFSFTNNKLAMENFPVQTHLAPSSTSRASSPTLLSIFQQENMHCKSLRLPPTCTMFGNLVKGLL